jgi:plastocyanin
MPKRTTIAVLALALLLVLAILFRREPRVEKPRPGPKPIRVVTPEEPPSPTALPVKPAPVAAAASPTPPPVAVQGPSGTLRGGVKILGEIPVRKRARLENEPKCQEMHSGIVLTDQVVADASGNVQWAFIQVRSGPIGTPPPAPTTPVLMDQIRCIFTPHMVGVRAGQPVRVRSSDDLLHNVHGLPFSNKEFNQGLPEPGEIVKTFPIPEIFVIKCDVHPWMRAWVAVVEHDYWSITNELGTYVIRDLPPGKYTIEAWHEFYKPVTREVQITPGGDIALDFVLDAKRD